MLPTSFKILLLKNLQSVGSNNSRCNNNSRSIIINPNLHLHLHLHLNPNHNSSSHNNNNNNYNNNNNHNHRNHHNNNINYFLLTGNVPNHVSRLNRLLTIVHPILPTVALPSSIVVSLIQTIPHTLRPNSILPLSARVPHLPSCHRVAHTHLPPCIFLLLPSPSRILTLTHIDTTTLPLHRTPNLHMSKMFPLPTTLPFRVPHLHLSSMNPPRCTPVYHLRTIRRISPHLRHPFHLLQPQLAPNISFCTSSWPPSPPSALGLPAGRRCRAG
ncbi:hypothetical protein B0F90DRAFT_1745338, partial [Multifurca ochricompacta]